MVLLLFLERFPLTAISEAYVPISGVRKYHNPLQVTHFRFLEPLPFLSFSHSTSLPVKIPPTFQNKLKFIPMPLWALSKEQKSEQCIWLENVCNVSLENSPCMSNGVITGPRAQTQISFKKVQRSKISSRREEGFQEQKEGRSKQRQQVFTASHRAADPASQNRMLYGPTWSKSRQSKMTDRILAWLPSAFVPRKAEVEEWGWKLKPKRFSWPACNRH